MRHARVTTREHGAPYSILKPVQSVPRTYQIEIHQNVDKISHLVPLFHTLQQADVIAFDFETQGTDPTDPDCRVVGVGFSCAELSVYIDFLSVSPDLGIEEYVWQQLLLLGPKLIAHNLYFDAGWIQRYCGKLPHTFLGCTFGYYRQLASEGWEGQRWGLKTAMTELLGWFDTNEELLDRWLIENGYEKNISKEKKDGYYYYTDRERWVSPNKAEMWRAPPSILGHYCALDADATYQLYTRVFRPALERFPIVEDYHRAEFLTLVMRLIEQRQRGALIDRPALTAHQASLQTGIIHGEHEFMIHPDVSAHIRKWESLKYEAFAATEPARYLKQKAQPPEPPKYRKVKPAGDEPAYYTKKQTVSKAWLAWDKRREAVANPPLSRTWTKWKEDADAGVYKIKVVSKNWIRWKEKQTKIIRGELAEYQFNLGSGDQLRWLFYDQLGHPEILQTDGGSGAINEKALLQFGDAGRLLISYKEKIKELGYVDAYLTLSERDSCLHPGFIVPGTLTCRLAGRRPNIQQMPKTWGTMGAVVPRPGNVFVDCDHAALEMVVLAGMSRDANLLKLYGPDAPPNDVYLFVGSQMPVIGPIIRAAGYDPDNPTPADIANAKKQCKKERSIAKVIVLASSYGAGAAKIHQTLSLSGVGVTFEEVQEIHRGYWRLFQGVKEFERQLVDEWRANGGWVLNGVGRPVGCAEKMLKDIVNRVVQSTGHDLHMLYVKHLSDILDEYEVPYWPVIWDWHDQAILECPAANAEELANLMSGLAYERLNASVRGLLPLSGEAMIINNLAECKLEG